MKRYMYIDHCNGRGCIEYLILDTFKPITTFINGELMNTWELICKTKSKRNRDLVLQSLNLDWEDANDE